MPAVIGVVKGWVEGGWALSKQWVLGIEKPRQAVLGNVARPPSSSAWPVPRAPNHTMGRPAWQAHAPTPYNTNTMSMPPPHTLQWHNTIAPHTLQWGRPTMQQLDTLEGNAWDTMPQFSTPTESNTCPKGRGTARPLCITRFLFGNSRCVRLAHAALADGRIHASYGW